MACVCNVFVSHTEEETCIKHFHSASSESKWNFCKHFHRCIMFSILGPFTTHCFHSTLVYLRIANFHDLLFLFNIFKLEQTDDKIYLQINQQYFCLFERKQDLNLTMMMFLFCRIQKMVLSVSTLFLSNPFLPSKMLRSDFIELFYLTSYKIRWEK